MRSVAPADYATLPRLAAPAGYICVIRDIDRDAFRINATDQPRAFVEATFDEAERAFGLELVSILETADLRATEAELYERHHARLSDEWLALDAYQFEELRRSILQIDAHSSHYLTPQRTYTPAIARPRPKSRYETLVSSYLDAPGKAKWAERQQARQTSLFKSYGAASLRRHNPPARRVPHPIVQRPSSLRAHIEGRIKYLIWNDPGCLLLIWIGLLALGLLYIFFVGIGAFAG